MAAERIIPGGPGWDDLAAHHLARYAFAAERAAGKRVLDAGAGGGYGAALLRASGAQEVVGVDIDAEAIAQAQQAYKQPGLEFLVDDCQGLPALVARQAGASSPLFDLIVNFENIEHLPHPEQFLAAAARLLSPQGTLLISTPDRAATPPFVNGRPHNPFHVSEWYRDEFLALLHPHFGAVEMRVQVEAHAQASRMQAVEALRQGLFWSNPVGALIWRTFGRSENRSRPRSWKTLGLLATPSPGDYPIVQEAIASIHGKPFCHFAICTQPRP